MGQAKILENVSNAGDDRRKSAAELLNAVNFTVDSKLDNLASKNTLSAKAATAKKIFSNYRKNQL